VQRRTKSGSLMSLAAAGLILLALAGPAWAQDQGSNVDGDDQIVLTGELVVEGDRAVDTAVIFDGPATIAGTVRQDLFVMNGDTEISGTVNGDVFVFNGDVRVRSGAEIDGDLVTQGTPQVDEGATIRGSRSSVATRFDYDVEGFGGRFAWWIGYTVSVLILGLLVLAFAPQLDGAVAATTREQLGSSIGWGIALFLLLPIVAVLLLVTIVGIPLGLFVLFALALIYTIGYAVATMGIGRLVLRSSSRYVAFLVGAVALRLLALIPVLGGWLWLLASAWGLGLLAAAIRAGRASRTEAVVSPPPMPVVS
jgi:cytoskeletal protein CcmA (bactofilin family)